MPLQEIIIWAHEFQVSAGPVSVQGTIDNRDDITGVRREGCIILYRSQRMARFRRGVWPRLCLPVRFGNLASGYRYLES